MTKSILTLVSTLTQDIVIKDGKEVQSFEGGPGLFISRALKSESIAFNFVHGPRLRAEIELVPGGEIGRVPPITERRYVADVGLTDWTIISTLLDEWGLKDMPVVPYLFIDVQGLVRDGRDFGKKKKWLVPAGLAENIYCLKGTAEEIGLLDREFISSQKNKLLIITHGAKGAEIFYRGSSRTIKAASVNGLKDTIGAGDTFFGFFVAALYKGKDPFSAAEDAVQKTRGFLLTKILVTNEHKDGIK